VIFKPKQVGDLELRDPLMMNQILREKIWWRWLKKPEDLWAQL
jgi:hypothetical protein